MAKSAAVIVIALFSLSGPQSPQEDVAALRKELDAVKAQQATMQRDLEAFKNIFDMLERKRVDDAFRNKTVQVGHVPFRGSASASVTMVEVSDYYCAMCRRHRLETQPQIHAQYVATGKIRYGFIDFPVERAHPGAFQAHEAAHCAGDQAKYWEMIAQLFEQPARDVPALLAEAGQAGLDTARFKTCLEGGKYAAAVKASISRMESLGIDGTPTFLIGLTPPAGRPMTVLRVVTGAMPFDEFKTALDSVLK